MPGEGAHSSVFVACLCADWCNVCRQYRSTFDALAAELANVQFVWIDIEESATLLEEVDIENFPTLMIGAGNQLSFFGPVVPQADVVRRLAANARTGATASMHDAEVELAALLARLQAFAARG